MSAEMCWTEPMDRALELSIGPAFTNRIIGDPREIWHREADFHRWLMDNPEPLADCLGISGLRFTHHETVVGYQAIIDDVLGRTRPAGGLRPDLIARDGQGRTTSSRPSSATATTPTSASW